MPKTQSIIWDFPIKGLNLNQAKRNQPQGTTPDCLNVLPYDFLSGRARGGTRPGTKKTYAAAIGGGASPVSFIGCTTIAIDSSSVVPSDVLYNQPFTGANGTEIHTLDANLTVCRYQFWSDTTPCLLFAGSATESEVTISSNTAKGVTLNYTSGCRYTAALALGATYSVKTKKIANASVGVGGVAARVKPDAPNKGSGIFFQFKPCTAGAAGYARIYYSVDGSNNTQLVTTAISAGSTAYYSTLDHVIELRVSGNTFNGYVDGNLLCTGTWTGNTTQTQVGFYGMTSNFAHDDFVVSTASPLASYRQTFVVAISNGSIYSGNIDSLAFISSPLNASAVPSVAFLGKYGYIVDGFSIQIIDLQAATVTAMTASAGTLPANCTLACIFNGRLVLAGQRDDPDKWYMSAQLAPTNWDYGAGLLTSAIAATTNPLIGQVGDSINAIASFTDDTMIFFCDHTIVIMNGDPGGGAGHLDVISEAIGGLGPRCWAKSPDGTMYFAGTGGFYKMTQGGQPQSLSDENISQVFKQIDRSTTYVNCVWDRDRHGCWIFLSPLATGPTTSYFYDARNGGFWPVQFPNDYGPNSATVYDGDAPADRVVLFGGRTGYIYQFDETLIADDTSTAISSYVWLGPFIPENDLVETKSYSLHAFLSEKSGTITNCMDWTLQAGSDADDALSASPDASATGTYNDSYGRQAGNHTARIKGLCFALKCGCSTLNRRFSFERMLLTIGPGGQTR